MSTTKYKVKAKVQGLMYNGILFRNKDEIDYAKYLDLQIAAKEIISWKYEPFSLQLQGVTYKPDFLIIQKDHTIKIVEIKGMRRAAGMMRYNLACKQFPFFDWEMLTAKRRKKQVWFEKIK